MYRKIFLFSCVFFLAIIPFFWLKPGYIDLGGDSSRLYFYDPINYLKSFPLYMIAPNGFNTEINSAHLIPFTLFVALLKKTLVSSYIVATLFNVVALVGSFLAIVGIVNLFLKDSLYAHKDKTNAYFAGIAAGLFYTFSPALTQPGWWIAALFAHNQFFLNPLLFFLLLKYLVEKSFKYLLGFLVLSFIFTPNFILSPYFFSFYPMAVAFLVVYKMVVRREKIQVKEIAIGIALFLLIQAFHYLPQAFAFFQSGSDLHTIVFSKEGKLDRGLGYFSAVEGTTKTVNNLFALPQLSFAVLHPYTLWMIMPILIVLGIILQNKFLHDKKTLHKTFLLLLVFFLVAFFFITAKMTFTSLEFYKLLFNVPGFGMFRNYVGQFSHVYIFFYTLVFAMSIFYIFSFVKNMQRNIAIFIGFVSLFTIGAFSFIQGEGISSVLNTGGKDELKTPIRIGADYTKILNDIREIPYDAKYLVLPMDDAGAQVLAGEDGGYRGPPTIAYISGKSVFSGLGGLTPFYTNFLSMVVNKDYIGIDSFLSSLGIRYLFYNSDPKIYDTFPGYPYAQAKKYMPLTQELYSGLIDQLAIKEKIDLGGAFHLYELKDYRPHIYIAKKNYLYEGTSLFPYVLPLPDNEDTRITLQEKNKTENPNDGLYVEAKQRSTLFNLYTKKSDNIAISTSTTPDLYTLVHPLLSLAAKLANDEENRSNRIYFDKEVLTGASIISDLTAKAGGTMVDSTMVYEELDQYKKHMISLANMIYKQNVNLYSPFINSIKLNKILVADKNRMYVLIKNSTLSGNEKNMLFEAVDKSFLTIVQSLNGGNAIQRTLTFTAPISQPGIYKLYVDSISVSRDSISLRMQDKYISGPFTFDSYWTEIGQYAVNNDEKIRISLTFTENIDAANVLLGVPFNNLPDAAYAANLTAKGSFLNMIAGVVGNIAEWAENSMYFIYFEYKLKNTTDWYTYKAVIETGDQAQEALLLLLNSPSKASDKIVLFNQPSDIEIRNTAIVNFSAPKLLLKSQEKISEKKVPPITFTKVNPTKYEIQVTDALDPYTLVFLDQFNPNWKLYLRDENKNQNSPILAHYFNGEVNEGRHRDAFLEPQTVETWGKQTIADKSHTMVNGYANSWYISPLDTKNKSDYTLILELSSQQLIYILLPISFITAGICLFWLIILVVRKKPDKNSALSFTKKVH